MSASSYPRLLLGLNLIAIGFGRKAKVGGPQERVDPSSGPGA